MFNPWEASFEEAQTEHLRGGHGVEPTGPVYQWVAVQQINEKKKEVQSGNGFAVLACVRDCLTYGLIAPNWLTHAFNGRYDAVLHFRAKSWDDKIAFGRPYPKGLNLNAWRTRRLRQHQVHKMAIDIKQRNPDTPIDEAFFERIGKEITPPCGKTEVSELYYFTKKIMKAK